MDRNQEKADAMYEKQRVGMNPFFKCAATGVLATFVAMSVSSADEAEWGKIQTVDWKNHFMTVAPVKRDAAGKLNPLQSYDETIRRGMSFILDDHLNWFK
ncbi:unnamed protein product, partial [marine sediment metagenome]